MRISDWSSDVCSSDLNHPKSYSIAALLHPELANEFEALQDRLRDQILLTWQRELNARRGHGGLIREDITDRKSGVVGKRVSVRVDLGGSLIIKKNSIQY